MKSGTQFFFAPGIVSAFFDVVFNSCVPIILYLFPRELSWLLEIFSCIELSQTWELYCGVKKHLAVSDIEDFSDNL